jgi:hypothetical protein
MYLHLLYLHSAYLVNHLVVWINRPPENPLNNHPNIVCTVPVLLTQFLLQKICMLVWYTKQRHAIKRVLTRHQEQSREFNKALTKMC